MFYGTRRTMTPVQRHKRAVAYRHVPYHPVKGKKEAKEEIQPLTILPIHQKQEKAEDSKPLTKRQKRKIRTQKLIALQAMQPHMGLLGLLINPIGGMQRSYRSCFVEYTWIGSILASLCVWLCIGWIPSAWMAERINAHAFSYAVVPFSMQCMMMVLIACTGLLLELAALCAGSVVSRMTHTMYRVNEVYDTRTHAMPFMMVISVLAAVLTYNKMEYAMAASFGLIGLMVLVDAYSIYLYIRKWKTPIWPAYAAGVFAGIPCGYQVMQIIENQLSVFTKLIQ